MAKILLIEPDLILANTYGQALLREGHDVMWCITAGQGILGADDTTPDIVILEPQLAEHGGIEFLFEFRSYPEWDNIPVVIFSRLPPADFSLPEEALSDLGILAYWHKSRSSLTWFVREVQEVADEVAAGNLTGATTGVAAGAVAGATAGKAV